MERTIQLSDTFYKRVTPARRDIPWVPLAFRALDQAAEVFLDGYSLSWSQEGFIALRDVWLDGIHAFGGTGRNLPYASLRGLLEVLVPSISRLERGIGLDPWRLKGGKIDSLPEPFLWAEGAEEPLTAAVQQALTEWIPNYLVETFARPAKVSDSHINRIFELHDQHRLIVPKQYHSKILPWGWTPETGTTRSSTAYDFANLAHYASRLLANTVVFPELGPLRRVVAVQDGHGGSAELITEVIEIPGKGQFSLVLRLEVVTFPSFHQPVLTFNVIKRRWLETLPDHMFARGDISGFMFPTSPADRAPSFLVRRRKSTDGTYRWEPDNGFLALQRHYRLPLGKWDGNSIARGDASTDQCAVKLVHRYGVADGRAAIKAGVPEHDKLDAFEATARALEPYGLMPLDDLTRVATRHMKGSPSAPMINAPTLIGAVLEADGLDAGQTFANDYLKNLGDVEVDRLLREKFALGLNDIQHGEKMARSQGDDGKPKNDQVQHLQSLIDGNVAAVERLYGPGKPQLAILHDETVGSSVRLLESVVRILWAQSLDVKLHRLPKNVHGSRESLPGSGETTTERFKRRVDAWKPLAEAIAATKRQTLCLVLAPEWYSGADADRKRPDDRVNKPAARKALATVGGATVQYLLPANIDRHGALCLTEFLHRVQAALKDLVSAHAGRIDGVAKVATRCFGTKDTAPREVIGITIVRQNAGRGRSGLEKTFLAVAVRVDIATGKCDMRFAHERHGNLFMSQWQPFTRALGEVAGASPVQLADKPRERGTRFMRFCEAVITESVEAGAQPVVIIDSSNCARLWPWLADSRIHASNIDVSERQWMQDDWLGARIVRVRQDLAPGIVLDKSLSLSPVSSSTAGKLLNGKPKRLRLPISPSSGTLYRLNTQTDTGCITYLSVGGKTLHQNKRGLSCYRNVLLPVPSKSAESPPKSFELKTWKPWTEQWPTPNPIELVVTLRQAGDDPDCIAEFVEALRHGFGHYAEWTSLPAPLFFERVIRDYISGFTLLDDETSESAEA